MLRDCPEERLVAIFFQEPPVGDLEPPRTPKIQDHPNLLQFSQVLIQQAKWIPCQDTGIPHLFHWRWAFLSYNRAPAPTVHICCRSSVQPIKTSLCKCCIFPKHYSYHTFYNMLPEMLFYGEARKSGTSTNLWGSSGSQFGRKLVTASATSSFNSTSQSPSVARIRTSSGPCSYCRRS